MIKKISYANGKLNLDVDFYIFYKSKYILLHRLEPFKYNLY